MLSQSEAHVKELLPAYEANVKSLNKTYSKQLLNN